MGTKKYDSATDLITFSRNSTGTALRKVSYGSELVTNGTFDTDATGWVNGAGSTTTFIQTGGVIQITPSGGNARVNTQSAITLEVGKTYTFTAECTQKDAENASFIHLGIASGNAEVKNNIGLNEPAGVYSHTFVATNSSLFIQLGATPTSVSVSYDNISVKEVTFDQAGGTLEVFKHSDDMPRIEYDENGTVKGLLIEEQRTNSFLNSDSPETQVVAVTPNTAHTLSFEGGSSVVDLDETIASTAVDVFVYDTSKDSDGGAWRTGTLAQAASWYNETLNTATRGSRQEFPAVAVIVAEATKVTIYDGDDPDMPMWMVFNNGRKQVIYENENSLSSVFALNGQVWIGSNAVSGHVSYASFVEDIGGFISQVGYYPTVTLLDRNISFSGLPSGNAIVNRNVNDVAMTVLPNAPIDAATGLQVPTIAVATDGGVSVIKDDGTVVDLTYTASVSNKAGGVWFPSSGGIAWQSRYASGGYVYTLVENEIPSSDKSTASDAIYANFGQKDFVGNDLVTLGTSQARAFIDGALGSPWGLTRIDEKSTTPAEGMVAYATSTYNTGWMNGDIKGAFLSDTDDTDLVGSGELVTNGTFDSDTSGWMTYQGLISWNSSGYLDVDRNSGTGSGVASTVVTGLTVGKVYTMSLNVVAASHIVRVFFGSSSVLTPTNGATGIFTTTHVATSTSHTIQIDLMNSATATASIDNVSVKLADADRSVNGNGLQVFGTVSKNPVATGADLVAYGPFSYSNALQQPYNSDLDFGTGDFCVMGWFKTSVTNTSARALAYRASSAWSDGLFRLEILQASSLSKIRFTLGYDGFTSSHNIIGSNNVADGVWHQVTAVRRNGTTELWVDGILNVTGSNSYDLSSSSAVFKLGGRQDGAQSFDSGYLALWRISATAPTAEQITKMYEDEKVLFQAGAQATLYGSSDAVTALAHDEDTGLLHVGTSAGRSVFNGLNRINNTTTGVTTAISAVNGIIGEQ